MGAEADWQAGLPEWGYESARPKRQTEVETDSKHPRPWRVDWTRFGESMGYDSRSLIRDAKGEVVVQIGTGASADIQDNERTAAMIVDAVNRHS